MAASKNDIREWLERGNNGKYSHMIVVCDTWDYDDFPVYVKFDEVLEEEMKHHNGVNMEEIMEVYNYLLPLEPQLNVRRAYNLEPRRKLTI